MKIHIGGVNMSNACVFTVGNRVAAQFNSDIIPQLIAQGGEVEDVKNDLKGMLMQAATRTGLDMNAENTNDLSDVVDKYVDIIVKIMVDAMKQG